MERDADRLADGLEAGEVDHRLDRVAGEDAVEAGPIEEVDVMECGGAPGQLFDPVKRLFVAVGKIVDDHHVVAGAQQFKDGVAADVARAAGDQDCHVRILTGPGAGK